MMSSNLFLKAISECQKLLASNLLSGVTFCTIFGLLDEKQFVNYFWEPVTSGCGVVTKVGRVTNMLG